MCNGHASMCAPAPGETSGQDKVYEAKQNCDTWLIQYQSDDLFLRGEPE